jgi:radial spoke head protein 1
MIKCTEKVLNRVQILIASGTYRYKSGAVYEGGWANNVYEGKGSYTFPDKSKVVGEWTEGKMNGAGFFCDSQGIQFYGAFSNNASPKLQTWI